MAEYWFESLKAVRVSARIISQFLIILFSTAVLTSCVIRPAESPEYRGVTPTEAVNAGDIEPASAPKAGADGNVEILALSGGGADGAYGVGVLSGWTVQGTRPEFEIVTGVSTGALMSVFAFLGPQYDSLLRTLYLSQTESDIFVERGITGILGDSLYDNTPLKRQIEKYVTASVLRQVAAEHARGRRLYVATTNLDSNELVVWDMGLLASGGGDGRTNSLQLFQKVLRASAAIPVLFPPVYIKPKRGVQLRQAHVDGGVKAPVVLSDFIFQQKAKKRTLYVIINGSLALENAYRAVQPNIKDVAQKTVSGLTTALTQQTVYRGYARSQNSGTDFNLTAIPDDIPPELNALAFNQAHLQRIYNRGFRDISKPGFWWKQPPTLRRFDRIARR